MSSKKLLIDNTLLILLTKIAAVLMLILEMYDQ